MLMNRVEVTLPPLGTVTLVAEKDRLTLLLGELVAERFTVPLKLPTLVIDIVELNLFLPFWLVPVKKLGLALILKSETWMMTVTLVLRDWKLGDEPVTITV